MIDIVIPSSKVPTDSDPSRLTAISQVAGGRAPQSLAALELGAVITTRRLRILEGHGGEPLASTREAIDLFGFRPVYNVMAFIAFVEALGSAATRAKAEYKLRRHAEAGLIAQSVLRCAGLEDDPRAFLLPLLYDFAGFFGVHDGAEKVAATIDLAQTWGLGDAVSTGLANLSTGELDDSTEHAASQALRYIGSTTVAPLPDDAGFNQAWKRRFSLDERDPVLGMRGLEDLNARVDLLFAFIDA